MPDEKKKKAATSERIRQEAAKKKKEAVNPKNTRKYTDYEKKATKAYAGPGTKLAKPGTEMEKMQKAAVKKRIAEAKAGTKHTEKTRPGTISKMAEKMRQEAREKAAFSNKRQEMFEKKGYFGK